MRSRRPAPRRERAHPARRGPLEWVGGRVTLPVYITEGEPYRPQAVIWLELPSELVIGWTVSDPAKPAASFADTLREAMRRPNAGPPRRPARVRVADETLATEARAALADAAAAAGPVDVAVAPTREIDQIVRMFVEWSGPSDEPESYLEDGRVPAAAVDMLFRAAKTLYHAAPWKITHDGEVVRLDVPELGIAGAAISIIGALGESLGFLVFPSLDAYDAFARAGERMMGRVRRGRPLPATVDIGSSYLSLSFDRAADLSRAMRREVLQHGWETAGPSAYPRVQHPERDGVLAPLTERDVRLATACAGALTAFVPKHAALFAGKSFEPVSESYTGETDLAVRLTAPYEAFDVFVDPFAREEGPMPAGSAVDTRHVGRNDPCPCGSGKKYKRCHLGRRSSASPAAPAHERDGQLASEMMRYGSTRFGEAWLRFRDAFADCERAAMLSVPWGLYHARVRGRTVAQWFLEERGGRLAPADRGWIEAQARAWLGIWEARDVHPGQSLDLEDLLTRERRHVQERTASRTLRQREAILARVVDHEGLSLLCGVHPQAFPPLDAAEVVRDMRARLRRGRRPAAERLRDEELGRDLIADWEATAAALEARYKVPPQMRNGDGDDLVLTTDRYAFAGAARPEIEELLGRMEGVAEPEEGDGTRDYPFLRPSADRPGAPPTLIGWARVADGVLTAETNSIRRADALRERLEARFGERLRHLAREEKDAKAMVDEAWRERDDRGARGARDDDDEASPEEQQALREVKTAHYADWPDRPLSALGGRTARQAVRTKDGRERVDTLLKEIEHNEALDPPAQRFDVSLLRGALGL